MAGDSLCALPLAAVEHGKVCNRSKPASGPVSHLQCMRNLDLGCTDPGVAFPKLP